MSVHVYKAADDDDPGQLRRARSPRWHPPTSPKQITQKFLIVAERHDRIKTERGQAFHLCTKSARKPMAGVAGEPHGEIQGDRGLGTPYPRPHEFRGTPEPTTTRAKIPPPFFLSDQAPPVPEARPKATAGEALNTTTATHLTMPRVSTQARPHVSPHLLPGPREPLHALLPYCTTALLRGTAPRGTTRRCPTARNAAAPCAHVA